MTMDLIGLGLRPNNNELDYEINLESLVRVDWVHGAMGIPFTAIMPQSTTNLAPQKQYYIG